MAEDVGRSIVRICREMEAADAITAEEAAAKQDLKISAFFSCAAMSSSWEYIYARAAEHEDVLTVKPKKAAPFRRIRLGSLRKYADLVVVERLRLQYEDLRRQDEADGHEEHTANATAVLVMAIGNSEICRLGFFGNAASDNRIDWDSVLDRIVDMFELFVEMHAVI
jgi:hypothetical protein